MNLNYNDYVVINGKKYFADGGETNIHQIEKVNEPPSKYNYITGAVDFQDGEKFINPRPTSSGAGHVFYERLGWENGKEGKSSAAMRNSCLNPCSNGICSLTLFDVADKVPPNSGLNPCSNGICSLTYLNRTFGIF